MISIKVLGPGCANCGKLAEVAQHAADFVGAEATVQKVTDVAEIGKYKVLATPGLVINEKVVCAGRIPTAGEVTTWLTNAMLAE
jgi:small redox-active disulfide protein 2